MPSHRFEVLHRRKSKAYMRKSPITHGTSNGFGCFLESPMTTLCLEWSCIWSSRIARPCGHVFVQPATFDLGTSHVKPVVKSTPPRFQHDHKSWLVVFHIFDINWKDSALISFGNILPCFKLLSSIIGGDIFVLGQRSME
jgi:hypothetical protein